MSKESSQFTFIETELGLCLDGAGPAKLDSLLRELDHVLEELDVNLNSVLDPGIAPELVREAFAQVGLVPPEELIVWYGWHNGLRVDAQGRYLGMTPFVAQADVDWSIANYRHQLRQTVPMGLWAESWLWMESDRGLSAYCSGNPRDLPLLRRVDFETFDFLEESAVHQVVSLSTMVALWIDAIEAGLVWPMIELGELAWGYDGPGLVAMDAGRCFLY